MVLALGLYIANLVSLETKAARLEVVVAELQKHTSLPLSVSAPLQDEVVFISANNVPAETLKNKIAECVHSTWVPRDGGEVLMQTEEQKLDDVRQRGKIYQAQIRWLLSDLKKAASIIKTTNFKSLAKAVEKFSETDDSDFGMDSPSERFCKRILSRLSEKEFADLTFGQNTIYTVTPNQMQRKITFDFSSIIDTFRNEQLTYSNSFTKKPSDREEKDMITLLPAQYAFVRPLRSNEPTILIDVSRDEYGPSAEVRLYDQNGMLICRHSGGTEDEIQPTVPTEYEAEVLDKNSSKIASSLRRESDKTGEVLDKRLLDPLKTDPLIWGAGNCFAVAAKRLKSPMIAHLSDSDIGLEREPRFLEKSADPPKDTDFLSRPLVRKDGWVLAPLQDRIQERMLRLSRRTLKKAIEKCANKTDILFSDLIATASTLNDRDIFTALPYLRLACPNFPNDVDLLPIRFLSHLSPDQEGRAMNNGVLVSQLSKEFQTLFNRLTFSPTSFPVTVGTRSEYEVMKVNGPYEIQDSLLKEATVMFPTGIPVGTRLILSSLNQDQMVLQVGKQRTSVTLENFGYALQSFQIVDPTKIDALFLASGKQIQLEFYFPGDLMSILLATGAPDSISKEKLRWETLPEQIRSQCEASRRMFQVDTGQGGAVPPPAPLLH